MKKGYNTEHPGCTLFRSNKGPAILLEHRAGITHTDDHHGTTVEYHYNSYGYRTREFDTIDQEYILVAGDSQTEGTGMHVESVYVSVLENLLGTQVINLGVRQASPDFIKKNIRNWLFSCNKLPKYIVVQWPNDTRMMYYEANGRLQFRNPNYANDLYRSMLMLSEDNLINNWVDSVIDVNRLCQALKISVVNISLTTFDDLKKTIPSLLHNGIELHYNKQNEKQHWEWPMDQGAFDLAHHSPDANRVWARNIEEIIKQL